MKRSEINFEDGIIWAPISLTQNEGNPYLKTKSWKARKKFATDKSKQIWISTALDHKHENINK